MAFLGDYNPNAEPAKDFDPIPAGTYQAIITESGVGPLKSGNGEGLNLTFQVIGGPFDGRLIWKNINIRHSSEKAQQIGQSEFRSLRDAVRVGPVQDSAEIHGRPLLVKVRVVPAGTNAKGYTRDKAGNEITAFLPVGAAVPPPTDRPPRPEPAETSYATGAAPAGAGRPPPWAPKR